MGCNCNTIFNAVESKIGAAFAAYGRFLARHPWKFIFIGILVNGLLGIGMKRLNSVSDVETVYTPINSQSSKDKAKVEEIFPDLSGSNFIGIQMPDLGRYGEVIVKPKQEDIFNTDFLNELKTFHTTLLSISTEDENGNTIPLSDICAKSFSSCAIDGDIFADNEFSAAANSGPVSYPYFIHSVRGPIYYEQLVGGVSLSGGAMQSATMLTLRVNLRTDTDYNINTAKNWQNSFLSKMQDYEATHFDISYAHTDSLSEELDKNVSGDIVFFSITFTLMITYACMATMTARCDCVGQMSNLGFGGVLAAGLAIVSSFGLVSACGVDFVSIVGVVPFLIIGIGVDDMFLLMSGITETDYEDTVENRIGETMRTSGVSITITSLTDLLAFAAGASSIFLSVRNFCIYSGVAVIFCYINQATIFMACITINEKRTEQNRHHATCLPVRSKEDLERQNKESTYLLVKLKASENDNKEIDCSTMESEEGYLSVKVHRDLEETSHGTTYLLVKSSFKKEYDCSFIESAKDLEKMTKGDTCFLVKSTEDPENEMNATLCLLMTSTADLEMDIIRSSCLVVKSTETENKSVKSLLDRVREKNKAVCRLVHTKADLKKGDKEATCIFVNSTENFEECYDCKSTVHLVESAQYREQNKDATFLQLKSAKDLEVEKKRANYLLVKLSEDLEKQTKGGGYIFCCSGSKPKNQSESESYLDRLPRWLIPKIVLKWPLKIVIAILFVAYLSVSIYGVTKLKQGLELKNLVAKDSYYYEYRDLLDTNFPLGTSVSFVFDTQMEYAKSNTQTAIQSFIAGIKDEATIQDSFEINWLTDFMASAGYDDSSEANFITSLQAFLAIPANSRFENDVVIDTVNNAITASRIHLMSESIKDSQEQGKLMLRMRELASAGSVSVFAFSPAFIYYEQYVAILSQTLQTVGIAVAMVFFVTIIFMPHPLLLVYVTVTVAMITTGIFGFLPFLDLTLSAITMIHVIMSIGFSVDFAAHICHGYMISKGKTRNERMKAGIIRSGAPVFHGAISSLLGVVVLAFAKSYIFYSFFQVMSLVVTFGISHALLLLPVILSVIGPSISGDNSPESGKVSPKCSTSHETNAVSMNETERGDAGLKDTKNGDITGGESKVFYTDGSLQENKQVFYYRA